MGSMTLRNGPDVSANANFTFYTCADQTACLANEYGGTSFAAPMWAAYIALVNQQLGAPIGFINPTIYAQNVTSSYSTDFNDITGGTSGSYSAVTGYDLVTGWGSPTAGLINALAGSSTPTPAFTISASPTAVSVVQGTSGSSTITTVSGGFKLGRLSDCFRDAGWRDSRLQPGTYRFTRLRHFNCNVYCGPHNGDRYV